MARRKLLIVDDEEMIVKQLQWAFAKEFDVSTAGSVDDAKTRIDSDAPELVTLDLSLSGTPGGLEGFEVLDHALSVDPVTKVIVISGHDEGANALRALERGAYDFYTKPIALDELRVMLRRAEHVYGIEREIRSGKSREHARDYSGIISVSPAMQRVFETVDAVAPTDVSVLVTGESGTGKELLARAIHERSPRTSGPFVPINCGAIPETLLESELFGHEKGSFTGADATRRGKFEVAEGGTVFLDEVSELGPSLQVKLLRFLQDRIVTRVGGNEAIGVDVRIIAATNRDLESMIHERSFREDLFYRINTIRIELPPLRDRGDDVMVLATHFLHRFNEAYSRNVRGFGDAAIRALHECAWRGNVRELENRMKRAVIMAAGKVIVPADLDLAEPGAAAPGALEAGYLAQPMPLKEARDALDRRMVLSALMRSAGNVSRAAAELEVSRPTLHDLIKKFDIDPADFRPRGRGRD